MLDQLRTTVLSEFRVDVCPTPRTSHRGREEYVLTLYDGAAGTLELLFRNAQDLRDFLTEARAAFAAAREQARADRARAQPRRPYLQSTLF